MDNRIVLVISQDTDFLAECLKRLGQKKEMLLMVASQIHQADALEKGLVIGVVIFEAMNGLALIPDSAEMAKNILARWKDSKAIFLEDPTKIDSAEFRAKVPDNCTTVPYDVDIIESLLEEFYPVEQAAKA